MIDSRHLHYRIVRRLGQGGMGVVYLAEDEKLGRPVALKFLPAHLPGSPLERDRLVQEARAASALNHPGICVIHAIEDAADPPFIVMEYVEGETLRERIRTAAPPIAHVLAWAIEIGEALETAHRRGLVHRDIKSDNIMITPAGHAKLMDFGLARIRDVGNPGHTTTTSGTLAYMAPEQFRDGAYDARSDLYAFGVVLYELLAGHTPFPADSPAATMYAVLNAEPAPVAAVRPGLSSGWQHVLDRALEKDPADRYQSMSDLLIDLRRLQRDQQRLAQPAGVPRASASPGEAPPYTPATTGSPSPGAWVPPPPRRRQLGWTGRIAAGLAAVAAAVSVFFHPGPPRLNPNMTFRTLTLPVTNIGYPGMSQDGRWIAFPAADDRGTWGVYFMNVNGTAVRAITQDSSAAFIDYVDVSPDGSQIAYGTTGATRGTSEIRVVSSLGGASVLVATGRAPHWTPDGRRVGYMTVPPQSASGHLELWSVSPDGSDPQRVFVDSLGTIGRISFAWSPDGQRFAWIHSSPDRTQELWVVPVHGGRPRQITHDHANIDEVCWTHQNDLVFSSNRSGNSNLWMVRASGGRAVQVTKGAGPDIGMRISSDGRHLLYLQSQPLQQLVTCTLGAADGRPVLPEQTSITAVTVSPDGRHLAAITREPDPITVSSRIAVMAVDGSDFHPIGEPGAFNGITWSPDGHALGYVRLNGGRDSSWIETVDVSTGAVRRLCAGNAFAWYEPTGMYVGLKGHGYRVDPGSGAMSATGEDSVYSIPVPDLGRTVVADTRGAGIHLYLRDRSGTQHPIGPVGGPFASDPAFTWIVDIDSTGMLVRTHLTDGNRQVFPRPAGLRRTSAAALTPDGRTLYYTVPRVSSKLVMIDGLR